MKINPATIADTLRPLLAQGLTLQEIGTRLGVAFSTIEHWRRRCGLPLADKFPKNFDRTYGPGSYATLMQALANGASLTAVARRWGFSRQYALQLRQRLMSAKETQ